jgi:hypothetical protein
MHGGESKMGASMALVAAAIGGIVRFAIEPESAFAGTFVTFGRIGNVLIAAGAVGIGASLLWGGRGRLGHIW